ncbi:MAG: molybdopterin-containing oxidoreductase family protein [Actinomycetota bacterium]
MRKFSICGMCAVRCPIEVQVEDGQVAWLQGNPNDPAMGASLCPKGAAGIAFLNDDERPQRPMIREGRRGEGKWREVGWDEALDYVGSRLRSVRDRLGSRGVALSDRGGPFNDLTKSFMQAIGSPNYFDHDASCGANAHHATRSLFGLGRNDLGYDYARSDHIVLYGRNMLESLQVKEVKAFLKARERGAKITYIDPRFTVTAAKATRFWQIRPNSDYALNLAIIHELLACDLYDKGFADQWVLGLDVLREATRQTTPEWAQTRTGIAADEIRALVREVAAAAPRVLFHAGWMTARHSQSFHVSRTAHVINTLLGAVGQPGGLLPARGVATPTGKKLNRLSDRIPPVGEPRADGAGGVNKHWDPALGVGHQVFRAMDTGLPYPIGAYIVYRHDPLTGFPDPVRQKQVLDKLDLLVAIDVNYSETAWYADVILPESSYLERGNIIGEFKGPSPMLAIRQPAVEPRFDTRPGWWIFRELEKRVGDGRYLDFNSLDAIWEYQLGGTGIDLQRLRDRGVFHGDDKPAPLAFRTPSGKIEFQGSVLEAMGLPSFPPFEPKPLEEGRFWLLFGRVAMQAHAQSVNNPLLNELLNENDVWIHPAPASRLGIKPGDTVRVTSGDRVVEGRARVTDRIHPDAVFMLHGFGRTVPKLTRACGRGMSDQYLQQGKLFDFDRAGGGFTYTETQVRVEAVEAGERP